MIHLTFDLLDSTLPLERSFPTFIFNAVDYLGHLGQAATAQSFSPGEALTARLPADATAITMLAPDAAGPEPVVLTTPTEFSWGPARSSGLHLVQWSTPGGSQPQARPIAVNLFSMTEGDIRALAQISLSEDRVEGRLSGDSAYTSLWPWILGLCLAVLMIEWWVYHKRTYI
jgi:hypothetical protein